MFLKYILSVLVLSVYSGYSSLEDSSSFLVKSFGLRMFETGKDLIQQGELKSAVDHFQNSFKILPTSMAATYIAMAYELMAMSSEEGFILDWYKKALELNNKNVQALLALGIHKHRVRDYQSAVRMFKEILAAEPNHVDAWFNLGVSNHDMGFVEEALSSYYKCLELDPQDNRCRLNLGSLYHVHGLIGQAIVHYSDAINILTSLHGQSGSELTLINYNAEYKGVRANLAVGYIQNGMLREVGQLFIRLMEIKHATIPSFLYFSIDFEIAVIP